MLCRPEADSLPTSSDAVVCQNFSDPANLTWERYVALQARERERYLAERATIGRPAFRAKYGKGPQHRNALRRCIGRTAQG